MLDRLIASIAVAVLAAPAPAAAAAASAAAIAVWALALRVLVGCRDAGLPAFRLVSCAGPVDLVGITVGCIGLLALGRLLLVPPAAATPPTPSTVS